MVDHDDELLGRGRDNLFLQERAASTLDEIEAWINLIGPVDCNIDNPGIVLVDEAHNFRHEATRRYQGLAEYLTSGEHKLVLLSATPQNLGPADIYHQLRLFLDDIDHGLDLEPIHLRDYFRCVQRWYEYRVEVENSRSWW